MPAVQLVPVPRAAQGKRGAGVSTDYATPLGYLGECKEALDAVIQFKP